MEYTREYDTAAGGEGGSNLSEANSLRPLPRSRSHENEFSKSGETARTLSPDALIAIRAVVGWRAHSLHAIGVVSDVMTAIYSAKFNVCDAILGTISSRLGIPHQEFMTGIVHPMEEELNYGNGHHNKNR